jgi:hypothetical protein
LTTWGPASFSTRTLLHGLSYLYALLTGPCMVHVPSLSNVKIFSSTFVLKCFCQWTVDTHLMAKLIGFIHTPVKFSNDRLQRFPYLQFTFTATSLLYTWAFITWRVDGQEKYLWGMNCLNPTANIRNYRSENVKYISGMFTNIIFCTYISGGALSTLVDWQRWRTSINTGANCRCLKDERNWQHLSTKIAVLTDTYSCRDPASKLIELDWPHFLSNTNGEIIAT